jgi:GntR family transcriptional regulator
MKAKLSFFHPYPKYLQIADILRNRILTQMQPGDRLPPEVNLSSEFGVSRETIRQALEPLDKEGLISRTRGRGSFVANRVFSRPPEKLTGMVEDFRALGLKTHAKLLRKEIVKADEEVARYLKLEQDALIVRIDRLRSLNEEPLVYHVAFLPADIGARVLQEHLEQTSIVYVLSNTLRFGFEEDQQIIEADSADVRLAEHLGVPIGSPILLMRRIYITDEDRPIAYFKSYYRSDRYMYTVKLRQPDRRSRMRDSAKKSRLYGRDDAGLSGKPDERVDDSMGHPR